MGTDDWVAAAASGAYHSPKLSKQFRLQGNKDLVWDQHGELKQEALGLNAGDECRWVKTLQLPTMGVPVELNEKVDAPRVEATEIKDYVKVAEYGKAVGWTGQIKDLAQWDIKDRRQLLLTEDRVHSIERLIYNAFATGELTVAVTGTTKASLTFTTNGTCVTNGTAFLNKLTFKGCLDYLEKILTPKIGGKSGHYRSILSVSHISDIVDDIIELEKYVTADARLRSEVGKLYNCRVMQDNGLLGNDLRSAVSGVFFGDDAVTAAVARPEYISYEPGRHGRMPELAWFTIRNYKKTWSLSTDDVNSTGLGLARILVVKSA